MNEFITCLKKYADFKGRARRKEYWMYALFYGIGHFATIALDALLGTTGMFSGLYIIAMFLPGLAVAVRRLHDTSRSGWWFLVIFVPVVGIFFWLFFMCSDSTIGGNRYGKNPKGISED